MSTSIHKLAYYALRGREPTFPVVAQLYQLKACQHYRYFTSVLETILRLKGLCPRGFSGETGSLHDSPEMRLGTSIMTLMLKGGPNEAVILKTQNETDVYTRSLPSLVSADQRIVRTSLFLLALSNLCDLERNGRILARTLFKKAFDIAAQLKHLSPLLYHRTVLGLFYESRGAHHVHDVIGHLEHCIPRGLERAGLYFGKAISSEDPDEKQLYFHHTIKAVYHDFHRDNPRSISPHLRLLISTATEGQLHGFSEIAGDVLTVVEEMLATHGMQADYTRVVPIALRSGHSRLAKKILDHARAAGLHSYTVSIQENSLPTVTGRTPGLTRTMVRLQDEIAKLAMQKIMEQKESYFPYIPPPGLPDSLLLRYLCEHNFRVKPWLRRKEKIIALCELAEECTQRGVTEHALKCLTQAERLLSMGPMAPQLKRYYSATIASVYERLGAYHRSEQIMAKSNSSSLNRPRFKSSLCTNPIVLFFSRPLLAAYRRAYGEQPATASDVLPC